MTAQQLIRSLLSTLNGEQRQFEDEILRLKTQLEGVRERRTMLEELQDQLKKEQGDV